MDISDQTVRDIFDRAFSQKAGKPFIVFADSVLTYGECKTVTGMYTTFFHQKGIKAGDRIVFSSVNDRFVCTFYLALMANGITAVFLDPGSGSERVRAVISHCGAKYVFADPGLPEEWNLAGQGNLEVTEIRSGNKEGLLSGFLNKKRKDRSLPDFMEELPETDFALRIDPGSDAYILYTSGTTSAPKGVRISYSALFSHLNTLTSVYQLNKDTRLFNNLVLSHADGIIQGPLLAFYNGASLYRPHPFSIQRIEDIFDTVYLNQITHWIMVPTMINLIFRFKQNDRDTLDHKNFKYVISCGGMLEAALWRQFEEKFKVLIINGYGLTETVAGGLFAGPDPGSHVIGSIGKPVDCEAKIMNGDLKETAAGEPGEIWIRGSLIMSGYLKAPEANRAAFAGDWFRTGDIGYTGEDGCFRIIGRKKNIIISGGINISPEEITEVLHSHPGVKDAVTFGLPDPVWGELVACAVVPEDRKAISSEDIVSYCRKHLEESKVPVKVCFLDALPYGRSGKVILQEAKDRVTDSERQNGECEINGSAFTEVVAHCFQMPEEEINLAMTAEDTPGWDSISHLLLIAAIEKRFNIEFSPVEVMNIKTLSDLWDVMERKIQRKAT